jgi:GxxExxY protein
MEWKENPLSFKIIGCALEVHRALGPGLLESAYERCLEVAFRQQGLHFEKEKSLSLEFRDVLVPDVYRLDFFVEGLIVVEIKSVQKWDPIFDAQLLTYLRLTDSKLGLLINFNVPRLRDGIKRIVLNLPST